VLRNSKVEVLLALVIGLCSFGASAEQDLSCGQTTTKIYFGNGVDNSLADATSSKQELKRAYLSQLENTYPEETFEFQLAYNRSEGVMNDVLEVFQQKLSENGDWLDWSAAEYLSALNMLRKVQLPYEHPSIEIFAGILEEMYAVAVVREASLSEHVQKYQGDLQAGHRVIIFAHSQGNLFANSAVQTVAGIEPDKKNSIRVIGVASPAASTVSPNNYWTAYDDRVINLARSFSLVGVLPGNVDNDPGIFNDRRDILNHSFYESYFDSTLVSRGYFNQEFAGLVATMPFPEVEAGDGAIRVTLKWGGQPDVDLHVYEPNGTHVYYSNRRGLSGFLDVDDTNGYGPENYFVSCESLETGTYRIGVNYYYGQAPEVAQVQISLSDGRALSFSQSLSTSRGSSGNNSPLIMATVHVARDEETGAYSYTLN